MRKPNAQNAAQNDAQSSAQHRAQENRISIRAHALEQAVESFSYTDDIAADTLSVMNRAEAFTSFLGHDCTEHNPVGHPVGNSTDSPTVADAAQMIIDHPNHSHTFPIHGDRTITVPAMNDKSEEQETDTLEDILNGLFNDHPPLDPASVAKLNETYDVAWNDALSAILTGYSVPAEYVTILEGMRK